MFPTFHFIESRLEELLHLFYPHNCIGCGSDLLSREEQLCGFCLTRLPHTGFARLENNLTEKIFRGRLNIRAGHSEFYFSKGKLVQLLIHQLKYKGNKEIGIFLGKMMGESLLKSTRFSSVDAVVPLPMHVKKEYRRGYNQATIIGQGIAEAMNTSLLPGAVIRSKITETQTNKHRGERWLNADGSFLLPEPALLMGKHILLVDDVITTGATLEACGRMILQSPGTSLSIATLAYASI